MSETRSQNELAHMYAKKGVKVFPVNSKKRPLRKGGHTKATVNKPMIDAFWSRNKNALIGSPNENFLVLDVDFKNSCDALIMLTEKTVERLYSTGVVDENTPRVRTPSGGYHFYFQPVDDTFRRMFVLPNVDLLSKNGFTLLPGQGKYQLENHDGEPWEIFDNLPVLDMEKLNSLIETMETTTKTAKTLKDAFSAAKRSEMYKKKGEESAPEYTAGTSFKVDPKTDKVSFDQTEGMYETSGEKVHIDSNFFDEKGKIIIPDGGMDGKYINAIFHTEHAQRAMARYIGVPVPPIGGRTNFRSMFPSHTDSKPSMGARWSRDGSHLIIKDFANHYGDKYNQNDYNLTRLHVTMLYDSQAPRFKPPEFIIWTLDLLHKAKLLDISKHRKSYHKSLSSYKKTSIKKIAERFLDLDALKSLYVGYEGETTFSYRFAAAWTGYSYSTVSRCRMELINDGFIRITGKYDCTGHGNDEGFFVTPLLSVVESETKYISPLIKLKEKKEMAKKEQMVSSVEMPVSQESYQKLVNFAMDFDIDNIPRRQNMFFQALCVEGVHKFDFDIANMTYLMGDLELEIVDGIGTDGRILFVSGESPALENLSLSYISDHVTSHQLCMDEPTVGFVLSYNYEGDGNLEMLTTRLNDYMSGSVSFDEISTRYITHDEMKVLLDGDDPEY